MKSNRWKALIALLGGLLAMTWTGAVVAEDPDQDQDQTQTKQQDQKRGGESEELFGVALEVEALDGVKKRASAKVMKKVQGQ